MRGMPVIFSTGELEKLSMRELVAIWNRLRPRNKVKSFPSKDAATMRILRAIYSDRTEKRVKQLTPPTKPIFIVPYPGEKMLPRDGTKIMTLYRMLKRGTTREEICSVLCIKNYNLSDYIRTALTKTYGYGAKENKYGILVLLE